MFCLVYNWQRYYSCKGSVSYHSRLCWAPSSAPPPSPLVSHASPPLLFFPLLTLWLEVALILRVFKAYAALSGHSVVFLHAWSWLMTEPCAGSSSRDPPHRLCMLTSEKRSGTDPTPPGSWQAVRSLAAVHSLVTTSHVVNLPHLSIQSENPVVRPAVENKAGRYPGAGRTEREVELSGALC